MKFWKAAVSGALMLGLLFIGSSAKSAEPIPGSEAGWYKCTSSVEGQVQVPEPKEQEVRSQDPGVIREWVGRDGHTYQEKINTETSQFYTERKSTQWERNPKSLRADNELQYNEVRHERPKRIVSIPLKKDDEKFTVFMTRTPRAATQKIKGVLPGIGLNENTGHVVDLYGIPMKDSGDSPTVPTLVIGRGSLDKNASIMMGLPYYETRWWKKDQDYGRTLWWDLEGTVRPLLRGYFHDDLNHQVKLVKGYGSIPQSKFETHTLDRSQLMAFAERMGFKLCQDAEEQSLVIPGVSVETFKEFAARTPDDLFYRRLFLVAGFPVVGFGFPVPAIDPLSTGATNAAIVAWAALDTRQFSIPTLYNQKGGEEAFWKLQGGFKDKDREVTLGQALGGNFGRSGKFRGLWYDYWLAATQAYNFEIRAEGGMGVGEVRSRNLGLYPNHVRSTNMPVSFNARMFGGIDEKNRRMFWWGPFAQFAQWDWHYNSHTWAGKGQGRFEKVGLSGVYSGLDKFGGTKFVVEAAYEHFRDGSHKHGGPAGGFYVDRWFNKPLLGNQNFQILSGFTAGVSVNQCDLFADFSPTLLRIREFNSDMVRLDVGPRFWLPFHYKSNFVGGGAKLEFGSGAIGLYWNYFPKNMNSAFLAFSGGKTVQALRRIHAYTSIREIDFPDTYGAILPFETAPQVPAPMITPPEKKAPLRVSSCPPETKVVAAVKKKKAKRAVVKKKEAEKQPPFCQPEEQPRPEKNPPPKGMQECRLGPIVSGVIR